MTTTAVPSKLPEDFALNIENLDKFSNSTSPTFTNRLGSNKTTLAGAIDRVEGDVAAVEARKVQALTVDIPDAIETLKAFNARGPFTTATAYALKDVYTSGGIAYVAVVVHTSTSVAADLAAGKVTIHQGATREDLLSASGATLIGANAYQTQDEVNLERLSVQRFGAVGDGMTNNDAAFALAEAASDELYLPQGVYVLSAVPTKRFYGPGSVQVAGRKLYGAKSGRRLAGKYLGQIATRCGANVITGGSARQIMSRSKHAARDNIFGLQMAFPNWHLTSSGESGSGGVIAVTASVEYPSGVFHQVTWGGSATVSIADLTTSPLSDPLPITIADGDEFFVKSYQSSLTGLVWTLARDANAGETCLYGASGVADTTMSSSTASVGGFEIYRPIMIVGETTKPSVLIIGDSREYGNLDIPDSSSDKGYAQRSVSSMCAFSNIARSGDSAAEFVGSHARRAALAAYFSHVYVHYGINDLDAGFTASQTASNLSAIASYFPGRQMFTATIEPISASTDGWTTVANQTVDSTNAGRIQLNAAIRAGLAGYAGFFEVADILESGRDSGLWRVWAGRALTGDGIHAVPLGNQLLEDSGAIDPRAFFDATPFVGRFASPERINQGKAENEWVSPAGLARRPRFRAVKGGGSNSQVFSEGVETPVTFGAEYVDIGRYFDTTAGAFSPPMGAYMLYACVAVTAGISDAALYVLSIMKNGVFEKTVYHRASGIGGFSVQITAAVESDGADVFTVSLRFVPTNGGSTTTTVTGNNAQTYFDGFSI